MLHEVSWLKINRRVPTKSGLIPWSQSGQPTQCLADMTLQNPDGMAKSRQQSGFWVYILQNPEGKFYIGQTDNVGRRLQEHNDPQPGLGKYTHKNGPWTLAWTEEHSSRESAMRREREIKAWKSSRMIREHLMAESRQGRD